MESDVKHIGREIGDVKKAVDSLGGKLDRFAETKADCADVDAVQQKADEQGKAIDRLTGAIVLIGASFPVVVTIALFIADRLSK